LLIVLRADWAIGSAQTTNPQLAIIKIGNHQNRESPNPHSAKSAISNQQSAISNQHFLRRPENRQSSNPHSANQHSAINNQQFFRCLGRKRRGS
jgi:hypothetical protein